ncbi:hypothetical protein CPJCM30710_18580 [Clostridium polyendosporum]|uniref:Uncharacterized protein n=1 Tax=Clostridium polyendosporum TaxID=69208 RepID=A0A919VGH3_9CLOT|nr:hypothetical protein [Clostridium polyendosporum]GIM29192.1 hypothetical protein CPJCM30710_18580 [Clostridium polyendosporum]
MDPEKEPDLNLLLEDFEELKEELDLNPPDDLPPFEAAYAMVVLLPVPKIFKASIEKLANVNINVRTKPNKKRFLFLLILITSPKISDAMF